MIDPNSQFFATLTTAGEAKQANADALGIPWKLTEMAVGDANGTDPIPDRAQTKLINERRRRPLNKLSIDPANPNILVAEQIIPADEGGWWIREIGLYDADGVLVAVANCAPSYKPLMSQGSGRTQVVRMNFIVSSAANVVLKIDPAVVLATRQYVDSKVLEEIYKLDSKQSVRAATTANIALAGLQSVDGVALVAGDRVLVKNQAAAMDNGLYSAAAGVWMRTADADTSVKVTSALIVSVEQGTTLADTRWQLVTDGAITLGTTVLAFQNVTQGFAPLASPTFTGNPAAPTPPQFDSDTSIATTEFVQRAQGNIAGFFLAPNLPAVLDASAAGKRTMISSSVAETLTLPPLVGLKDGAKYYLQNNNGVIITVAAQNGHKINAFGANLLSSFTMLPGATAVLIAAGNQWLFEEGSAAVQYSPEFAKNFGTTGFQKLPSGFVEQWGMVTTSASGDIEVTYPLAWTAVPTGIHVSPVTGQDTTRATTVMSSFRSATILTKFSIGAFLNGSRLGEAVYWRAIGKV
ncbi:phage tail protein [Pseudomonas saponiphila]